MGAYELDVVLFAAFWVYFWQLFWGGNAYFRGTERKRVLVNKQLPLAASWMCFVE